MSVIRIDNWTVRRVDKAEARTGESSALGEGVIDAGERFSARKCPVGSMAMLAGVGMVQIERANALERIVSYSEYDSEGNLHFSTLVVDVYKLSPVNPSEDFAADWLM